MNLSYFSFTVKGEEMNHNFREGIDRGEVVQERSCETDRFSSLPSSIYLVQEGKKDQIKNE